MRGSKTLALAVTLLLIKTGWGQQITGNLEGRVLNQQNEPLADVNVEVSSPSLQGTRGSASDDNGTFRFPALPVGTYEVRISHIAFQDQRYENVRIRLGKTTWLGEIHLKSRALEMSEVIVTSSRPQIDPTTTATGTNLARESFEALPVERNFRSISVLTPQANASFFGDEVNISGSTGLENVYFIDGVNTTDPNAGRTSTNLPYNFIKEIEIKTGGYEAEFRSALGGIINVITHSGSNEFRGQAFGFFTNQTLRRDPRTSFVDANKGDFSKQDLGFSIGGPISRDRLWFFTAYSYFFEREEIEIPGFGLNEDRNKRHIFAGKLTWRASDNTNMVLSIFGDPARQNLVAPASDFLGVPTKLENIDPYLARVKDGGVNLTIHGRHVINKNVFLEVSGSRFVRDEDITPRTERGRTEPLLIDLTQQIWSGGYGEVTDRRKTTHHAAKINGTMFFRNHTLKAGFEYEDNLTDTNASHDIGVGGFVLKESDSLYTTFWYRGISEVRHRVPSLFVQDSWRMANRLRVNLGLRWDSQYFVGSNGRVAQSITDQYQPRIGFAYQPGKVGSQKIFGSYGRFYEQVPTLFSSNYFIEAPELVTTFNHNPLENPADGDTLDFSLAISPEVKGLEGQYFDEFILGYEREIANNFKLGVSGIYRNLGQVLEDVLDSQKGFIIGNPGRGDLSAYPDFKREYVALELTLEKFGSHKFNFLASYVLSRNYGNYAGLFNSETGNITPNWSKSIDLLEQIPNSTGLLPNDRTHVLKFNASYRFDFGLIAGAAFVWQTGTPLTEFGATSFPALFSFASKRGSAGRTPSIWDLNFRFTYNISRFFRSTNQAKLILDIFHLGSQRKAVTVDQTHFFSLDDNGNQINENPNYLKPISFQPPMTVRLGLEVGF